MEKRNRLRFRKGECMIAPYIVFNKQCEEAVNFYEKVFHGTNKEILRYDILCQKQIKNYLKT